MTSLCIFSILLRYDFCTQHAHHISSPHLPLFGILPYRLSPYNSEQGLIETFRVLEDAEFSSQLHGAAPTGACVDVGDDASTGQGGDQRRGVGGQGAAGRTADTERECAETAV